MEKSEKKWVNDLGDLPVRPDPEVPEKKPHRKFTAHQSKKVIPGIDLFMNGAWDIDLI